MYLFKYMKGALKDSNNSGFFKNNANNSIKAAKQRKVSDKKLHMKCSENIKKLEKKIKVH